MAEAELSELDDLQTLSGGGFVIIRLNTKRLEHQTILVYVFKQP
jgi:hypothetical protein